MKLKDEEIRYKSGPDKGKIIVKYLYIIKNLLREAEDHKTFRLHLCKWSGSFKHMKVNSEEPNYRKVLDVYGIKYNMGNDAPRGGLEGDYIEVIVDRRNPFWKGVE